MSADSLQIRIVTPSKVAWEGSSTEIQVPGLLGEFGVLPGHASLLSATRPGRVRVFGESGTELDVGAGFADVGSGTVTLLVDSCEVATAGSTTDSAHAS